MKHPYSPPHLPPKLENLYTSDFIYLLGEANRSLAKLGEMPNILPNEKLVDRLAAPLLRKEAILSSKIEGTQTTMGELLKYEAQISDVKEKDEKSHEANKEVENYVKAMHKAMQDIKQISLTLRTIKNMHEVLLSGARRDQGVPGEFRDYDAYIGPPGTPKELATYVASPPEKVLDLMNGLENYINKKNTLEDPLVQCALIHYQFEAIHPFGDGNGRIGRLLVPLFFYYKDIIKYPFVYVSEFFETNHQEYYSRLLNVTENNDWKGWIEFFLKAIREQSETTNKRGQSIIQLYKKTQDIVHEASQSSNAIFMVEHIFQHPYTVAPLISKQLKIAPKTARSLAEKFISLGLLRPGKGKWGSRPVKVYVFTSLLDIIKR